MTTSASTIEGIARVTGDRIAVAARIARVLGEAGLYSKDRPGGGKNASSPNVGQSINLALGLSIPSRGDPLTHAPEGVVAVRSFVSSGGRHVEGVGGTLEIERQLALWVGRVVDLENSEAGLLPACADLGTTLDALVDHIARPEGATLRAAMQRYAFGLSLTSSMGGQLRASITCGGSDEGGRMRVVTHEFGPAQVLSLEERKERVQFGPGLTRSTVIPPTVFFALADMWADTLARQTACDLPPPGTPTGANGSEDGVFPTGAKPKTENGAAEALPGAPATPSNTGVQPRANGTSSHSAENRETEVKPQGLSRARLDASLQFGRHCRPGDQPHAHAPA